MECYDREEVEIKDYVKNAKKMVTVPANAQIRRGVVEERMETLKNSQMKLI